MQKSKRKPKHFNKDLKKNDQITINSNILIKNNNKPSPCSNGSANVAGPIDKREKTNNFNLYFQFSQ